MTREQEAARAFKLMQALGENYNVKYDDCESCLTRVYYKGVLIKEVHNSEMANPRLCVNDYAAPLQMVMMMR